MLAAATTKAAPEGIVGDADTFEWPRYPRILLASDDTPAAVFALRHVAPYAIDHRSQLTLLTVVPRPPLGTAVAGVSPERIAEEMETEAATHLRNIARTLPQDLSGHNGHPPRRPG